MHAKGMLPSYRYAVKLYNSEDSLVDWEFFTTQTEAEDWADRNLNSRNYAPAMGMAIIKRDGLIVSVMRPIES